MTDRQRLTWQQTFFRRVISLSTARWFFSLLSEQWWRERHADGDVIVLKVMRVQGLLSVENSWMKISVVSETWSLSKKLGCEFVFSLWDHLLHQWGLKSWHTLCSVFCSHGWNGWRSNWKSESRAAALECGTEKRNYSCLRTWTI